MSTNTHHQSAPLAKQTYTPQHLINYKHTHTVLSSWEFWMNPVALAALLVKRGNIITAKQPTGQSDYFHATVVVR